MTRTRDADLLVPLAGGQGPGTLLLHPAGGGIGPYLAVAGALAGAGPVQAVRAAGLLPGETPDDDLAAMADRYAALVDRPPAVLFGWSMGGVLAWELAVRFAAAGHRPSLVMVDSTADPEPGDAELRDRVLAFAGPAPTESDRQRVGAVTDAHLRALAGHRVWTPYDGPVLLLRCPDNTDTRWPELAPQMRTRPLDCGHFDVFDPEHLPAVLAHTEEFLR